MSGTASTYTVICIATTRHRPHEYGCGTWMLCVCVCVWMLVVSAALHAEISARSSSEFRVVNVPLPPRVIRETVTWITWRIVDTSRPPAARFARSAERAADSRRFNDYKSFVRCGFPPIFHTITGNFYTNRKHTLVGVWKCTRARMTVVKAKR